MYIIHTHRDNGCGGKHQMGLFKYLTVFPAVKKFGKLIKI